MPISQQRKVISTSFKNIHTQEKKLKKAEGALIRAGALNRDNTVSLNYTVHL